MSQLTSDGSLYPTLNIDVSRNHSKNYIYTPISSDFLFTLETKPTVQVRSNGMLGGCLNFNCEYKIDASITPNVTSYFYSPESSVSVTVDTPNTTVAPPPVVNDDLSD